MLKKAEASALTLIYDKGMVQVWFEKEKAVFEEFSKGLRMVWAFSSGFKLAFKA